MIYDFVVFILINNVKHKNMSFLLFSTDIDYITLKMKFSVWKENRLQREKQIVKITIFREETTSALAGYRVGPLFWSN